MNDERYRKVYSTLPEPAAANPAQPPSPKTGFGGATPTKPAAKSGAPGIRLERKGRGGKSVTVIEGLAKSDDELKAILKELQRACGTGGTVKGHHIELQGDFQAKARDWWSKRSRNKS